MSPNACPFATAGLPGTGGRIRSVLEDFQVEELPLYEACGAGEHVYLKIEKRGMSTLDAIARLARAVGCPRAEVGYAGLKDAHAVAIQTLSFAQIDERRVDGLELPGLKVLAVARHRNKLKKGHLRGNRFLIRVRGAAAGAEQHAAAVLATLAARGVPNFFGPQRFGVAANTHLLGRAVLKADGAAFFRTLLDSLPGGRGAGLMARLEQGDAAAAAAELPRGFETERRALELLARCGGDRDRALLRFDRQLRGLYLSALQADLFNAVLAERLPAYERVEVGDLAWLHRNGAVFAVDDAEREAPRAAAFEISPSGPLFGPRMTWPGGRPKALEEAALLRAGLGAADFGRGLEQPGARRPLRVPLQDVAAAGEPGALCLAFTLPPGAYATIVLREVMKVEPE